MVATPATSLKDPRLAAVATILEKKKISIDQSHMPVLQGGSAQMVSNTGEKLASASGLESSTKRVVI